MRQMNISITDIIFDIVNAERVRKAFRLACSLVQCALRIFILRPLFLLSCLAFVVIAAVPVMVLISPAYTPDVLTQGILRIFHLLPDAYVPLWLAGLLFELVYQVNRICSFSGYWPDITGRGRG